MSGNYVSAPFCFCISSGSLQRLSYPSKVTISVDSSFHPVYFQASTTDDPPQGDNADGNGIAVYSSGEENLGSPLSKISIAPGSISFTLSKPDSRQSVSDLIFDLFLWATEDIDGNKFGLHLDADIEVVVSYGWDHGVAEQQMEWPGRTTEIIWQQ
ncbi:hypothetical protein [Burkholderia sp. FL-7-2-10-S1-D7]|uniref:hypothetical protein n=1 Tax=Burkholderia sp. FL-7-2-10-S1-D7 TaxID=1637866 RepID=UPI0012E36B3E|nr:hypothetical protein [Burkholderia sp. FL-7-2-10-S1-D7]